MEEEMFLGDDISGSTAVICLLEHYTKRIWVANIGDSKCMLIKNNKLLKLTTDHVPNSRTEYTRIKRHNGTIKRGRVMGMLGVTRSIGDKEIKALHPNMVINTPEITKINLQEVNSICVWLVTDCGMSCLLRKS
eukprot:TRINITY_DN5245_c0_g1_i1.p1 TRINITY_DN5245_c0_g1~~TRINITY_DN5245_c0_g1_i1.p1  ORF type:complete len:134 (-),score=21.49 TRINITY_DN5245_c0_g1_i1:281-682(-)